DGDECLDALIRHGSLRGVEGRALVCLTHPLAETACEDDGLICHPEPLGWLSSRALARDLQGPERRLSFGTMRIPRCARDDKRARDDICLTIRCLLAPKARHEADQPQA